MDLEHIVSDDDFIAYLRDLAARSVTYHEPLERYLRGVLTAVSAHEQDIPTNRLLARIFTEGFTVEPAPFDPAWFDYTAPPDVITAFNWDGANPFAQALRMLRYQIADLRRMAAVGALDRPYRAMGTTSPTGHSWYNFEPQSFLDSATYGLKGGQESTECTWADLAIILWLGQIYE